MNSQRKSKVRVPLAIVVLAVVAGCGGTNASSPLTPLALQSKVVHRPTKSQPKLYVTNINGSLLVYTTGKNQALLQTITDGVPRPYGVWVDQKGIVYVVNLENNFGEPSLSEYKPGASTPFFQITSDVLNFGVVAVDSSENMYVSGLEPSYKSSYVDVYPQGSSTPSETLEVPTEGTLSRTESLTFDPSGNLLVGVAALPKKYTTVLRLPQGSQKFANLGLKRAPGGLAAADAAGDLYVGGGTRVVAIYPPGATQPKRRIFIPAGTS